MGNPEVIQAVVSVFAVVAVGAAVRKLEWLSEEADRSLLKLIVRLLLPALILDVIVGNEALRQPDSVLLPPLVGFVTIGLGLAAGGLVGRLPAGVTGLSGPRARRTFAFCVGIYNYGYIPLPLILALYGRETAGILLVHNVGVELAFWTVGLLVLTGGLGGRWWRQILNPPLLAIVTGLVLNALGVRREAAPAGGLGVLAAAAFQAVHMLAVTMIPTALLLTGATMADHFQPRGEGGGWGRALRWGLSPGARVAGWSCLLRLGVLPALFLLGAWLVPLPPELKRVVVVQAAMPAAVFPVIMAKHYNGDPPTALRVILATSLVSLLTISLWVTAGTRWLGV